MKDDKLYLIHIAERIGQFESYTQSGRDAFMQTRMIQDAVILIKIKKPSKFTGSQRRISGVFLSCMA